MPCYPVGSSVFVNVSDVDLCHSYAHKKSVVSSAFIGFFEVLDYLMLPDYNV